MTDWIFTTKSKGDVRIEWADDEAKVWTLATPPNLIGSITFKHVEGADFYDDDHYVVTNMYLDGPNDSGDYKRQGIGQEILSQSPYPVTFYRHDGIQRDDGGHLTGEGPGFAEKMVEKGLASWEGRDD